MIDADHFKQINDTYGHHVGDEALVAIANALAQSTDRGGMAARLGGEEFVIVWPGLAEADAGVFLEGVRSRIERIALFDGDRPVRLSVSIGATFDTRSCLDEMLSYADEAVYRAKKGGRNRVEMS